jgi:sucrose phosphorylase
MTLKNEVQLIVYPDSLGGDLVELHYVLRRYFSRAVGGVHLLPFYPSSADRGFAPLTYDEVDPVFGTWRDIDLIGREFDLIIDFMVNHISRQSVYFQDYFEKGPGLRVADMFLSFNKLSPTGESVKRTWPRYTPASPDRRTPPFSAPMAPGRRSGAPLTMNRSIWTGIHPKPMR